VSFVQLVVLLCNCADENSECGSSAVSKCWCWPTRCCED